MQNKRLKILNVVGARPNFIKIAPLIEEQKKYPRLIAPLLVHTGQHYDYSLSQKFFEELKIPQPDIHLNVGSDTQARQTGKIMIAFEKVLLQAKPDLLLVVGDVNSTLSCSLAACKLHIPIAHVEAGLRSGNWQMPEEINRILTDRLSDLLFATDNLYATKNLLKEGIAKQKIHFVGNVMIDTLLKYKNTAKKRKAAQNLGLKDYILLTLHRPENVDNKKNLQKILQILKKIPQPIVLPLHPRTKKMMRDFKLTPAFKKLSNLRLIEPQGYLDFLNLQMNAKIVLTDSGGIQEETTILKIPCLTLRQETERPITVTQGTNTITGLNKTKILRLIKKCYQSKNSSYHKTPGFWDGQTAKRIIKIILKNFADL